ncbi:MAG: flavodoxin-dependent (E)-4-hydroxy-3-methylbut-2-enyl-diphosphate synthase [Tissierellia bacterium]|nr:flavodoxin-dependent (E)-4-hydroxy-3-methylbut-2-enyl-diphosphate synthase [Tissierellia bacterium]
MRRQSRQIFLGATPIGGDAPISVQSMCNTDTKDVEATVSQILDLEEAGCDIIRLAVNSLEDAKALPKIRDRIHIPIISDIQFDYKLALYAIDHGTEGLRLNPGNIGADWKVKEVVGACKREGVPIRVGVNSGSIKQAFLDKYQGVNENSICYSALEQVRLLEKEGFYDIKVALKSSDVGLSVASYRKFAQMTDYPLHLGITEAGPLYAGTVKSAIGIGSLLLEGIGDTLRCSLSADPVEEVKLGREILKSLGLLKDGIEIVSCPTCARTKIDLFGLVEEAQKRLGPDLGNLKIAIMGCVVNGPGEAREADYGITGGEGQGVIFKKGQIVDKVPEEDLLETLIERIKKDQHESLK